MKKLLIVGSLGALALGTSGCGVLSSLPVVGGLFGGGADETVPLEPQPIVPSPVDGVAQAPAGIVPSPADGTEPLAEGEVPADAENPDGAEEAAALTTTLSANGLTPSTNSTARLRQVSLGRDDPFALVPVVPTPSETAGIGALGAGAGRAPVPPIPRPRDAQRSPQRATPRTPSSPSSPPATTAARPSRPAPPPAPSSRPAPPPVAPQPIPISPQPIPDFAPDLPPLPQPDLARAVRVTGVVQVGGETRAIVEPPNENSRYVRVGDYLANGQVLVKRIDVNAGPQPVVILEQFGVEVSRPIGDDAPGAPQATAISRR